MDLFYNCPICGSSGEKKPSKRDGDDVRCRRCGQYFISASAIAILKRQSLNERQVANLSGWIRENPDTTIDTHNLDNLLALKTPSVSERAEKLMRSIEKNSEYIGHDVKISCSNEANAWLSISWSRNKFELMFLVQKYLIQERNWVSDSKLYDLGESITVQLTPSGYAHLDTLRQGRGEGTQGFCAMWFNKEVDPIWTDAIAPAIADAGFHPTRIDKIDHNNRIDDEILSQIRRSRFLVADFTGNRGGVYFEAGFALGLGIQVIWTVREEELRKV